MVFQPNLVQDGPLYPLLCAKFQGNRVLSLHFMAVLQVCERQRKKERKKERKKKKETKQIFEVSYLRNA